LLINVSVQALDDKNPIKPDNRLKNVQTSVPYALDKTLQSYYKTVHGGVQHVVIQSVVDTTKIKLIQAH
jgi:hypothetical protein